MIKANFNTYNNYVTDSLYQWDVNQDLIINGLNLSVAPEIHFANANMERAIVRQSTLESGVVTVRIPNSLLQEALTIKAYVGLYEGETFNVIETIEIPVIAKARPSDYVIEDTDGEIYSFKALENEIVNAKKEIADKCDANLVELSATVNARVDNIIAHNNDTDGNSELIDIRVGADGTIYNSAGEAVRSQVKGLTKTFANENIFDEEKNSTLSGTEHKNGVVKLDGTEQVVVISTTDGNHAYITSIKLYDDDDIEISDVSITSKYNDPNTRSGKIVQIPTNARKLTFRYRFLHASSGNTLCSEMMVTIGETIPLYYKKCEYINILVGSPYVTKNYVDGLRSETESFKEEVNEKFNVVNKVFYVSTNGNDTNDGLSKETPLATINKAIELGAKEIAVEVGEYPLTKVIIENKNNIHIYAYDDDVYSHDKPIRDKAHLIGGQYYTDYSLNDDGVYHCAGVSTFYSVVLIDNEESKATKFTTAISYEDCVSTEGTYYLNGTDLFFNTQSTTFKKIATNTKGNVLVMKNCHNVLIEDISFNVSAENVVDMEYCSGVVFNNCEANYSLASMGFSIDYTNAIFNNCSAYRNKFDGFNFHGYGVTVMNDCESLWNGDDGCSHHYGCVGTINGGRFIGNGKGGITPAYGATVNIYNAFCDCNDNYGIGYLSTNNGHAPMKGIVNSCVMVNNKIGLFVGALCDVITVNCKYSNNTMGDKSLKGTCLEF